MMTDLRKIERLKQRVMDVLVDMLDDNYTGDVGLEFKMQDGGVVSKKILVGVEK